MAPQPLTTEPNALAAGTSIQWTRSYGEYSPTDGWALTYYFRGAGSFNVAAVSSSGSWLVTVAPSVTAQQAPGSYRWTAFAERGTGGALERYRVAAGALSLTADITDAAPGALQPHAEKMLAAIEAVLEGRASSDQEAYAIGDRQLTRIPFAQLVRYRNQYAAEARRLRGGGKLPAVTVLFGRR